MQRRRGLVSQSSQPTASTHARSEKRDRSGSDKSSGFSSSESSGFSSSDSDREETRQEDSISKNESPQPEPPQTTTEIVPDDGLHREEHTRHARKGGKDKKKDKPDYSDENRWKKMKLKGSEKEIMIDMTRVQRYVDYDSAGVIAVQQEVEQAKGNFRQQQMADYSDL